MRINGRFAAAVAIMGLALAPLAGCSKGGGPTTPMTIDETTEPTATATSEPTPDSSTPPPAAMPPGCIDASNGAVGNATVHYQDFDTPLPLNGGSYTNVAGTTVSMRTCAVGDLDGDGANEALAALEYSTYGTDQQLWTLVAWHVSGDAPIFVGLLELGDRTGVQSIAISGGAATVVWLTRGPTDTAPALTIRRTSVVKLTGTALAEASHTDEAYSGT